MGGGGARLLVGALGILRRRSARSERRGTQGRTERRPIHRPPTYIRRRPRLRFRVPQVLANRSLAHLHLAQSAAADEAKRGERPAEHVMEALGGDTVAAAMTKGAIGAAQAPLPMLL